METLRESDLKLNGRKEPEIATEDIHRRQTERDLDKWKGHTKRDRRS